MANLSNINNKFLVTTGGNVLIGQTSVVGSSILQVTGNATFAGALNVNGNATLATYSGTGENYTILAQNDYGQMRAGIRSGVPYIGSISSLPLDIYTGNSSKIRIETSGLVSLPTTGLNDTRHIIFTGTQGTANNAGNLGMWGNEVRLTSNWYYNGAQQKVVAGNGMGVMAIGTGTTDASCYLSFGINGPAATGGPTERMRISSSGNVGIGFAPGHDAITKLELPGSLTNSSLKVGTVETQSYSVNNAWVADNIYYDGVFRLRSAGYGSQIYFGGGGDITFNRYPTGSAGAAVTAIKSLQLQSNGDIYIPGNVGIGTASPTNGKLEVQQTATTAALWVQTGGTTSSYTIADFRTGTNAPALAIKGDERVGIGTDSPSSRLHVSGDAYVTGQFGQGVTIANKLATYGAEFRSSGASAQIFFGRDSGNVGTGGIGADATYVMRVWKSDFSQPFVIKQSGQVGIGTTSPLNKLQVNGDIGIGEINSNRSTNVRFAKNDVNVITFDISVAAIGAWRPGSCWIQVSGTQNGLQEYWSAWYFIRLTHYYVNGVAGQGSTNPSCILDSGGDTSRVVVGVSSTNSSDPQIITITLTDVGGSTNSMVADINCTMQVGINSIT